MRPHPLPTFASLALLTLSLACTPSASHQPTIHTKIPATATLASEGTHDLFFAAPSSVSTAYLLDPHGNLLSTFALKPADQVSVRLSDADTAIFVNNKPLFRHEGHTPGSYALYTTTP